MVLAHWQSVSNVRLSQAALTRATGTLGVAHQGVGDTSSVRKKLTQYFKQEVSDTVVTAHGLR
jgi:hypothetical protein